MIKYVYAFLVPCNAMLSRLFSGILVKRRQSIFSHMDRVDFLSVFKTLFKQNFTF